MGRPWAGSGKKTLTCRTHRRGGGDTARHICQSHGNIFRHLPYGLGVEV